MSSWKRFWSVAEGGKRTFWGVTFMPICYVLFSFILDLTLFLIIKIPFPKHYTVSVLFLIAFAGAISCIPNRWVQFGVFFMCCAMQTITTIANLIAYHNLKEMFIFETLRDFREAFSGAGAAKYGGAVHITIVSFIVAIFLAIWIFTAVKYRKQKAGYPLKPLAAVASAVMIAIAGIFTNLAIITPNTKDISSFQRITDPRFNLQYLTDRTSVLFNFGSPIYYFNNLLGIVGLKSMRSALVAATIDKGWDGADYYSQYTDNEGNPLMLDANYNCIMLMMETMEFNGINPTNTPNLWNLRNKSTWVDGYYSIERTTFSEYVSLTGAAARGVEMGRDYPDLVMPQSIPNIFRRSYDAAGQEGSAQITAFHTYDRTFYNRDYIFNKSRLGFDYIKDLKDYVPSTEYTDLWSTYSDEEFMQNAVFDMAPKDRRFFSWYLGVSAHAPHFKSPHTQIDPNSTKPFPYNVTSIYADSLKFVQDNFEQLSQDYSKLVSGEPAVEIAALAYVVSLHEYDRSIGILMDYLNETGLINNTALVLYSDHYDYMAYNYPTLNPTKGSLLSNNHDELPTGEKCAFMVYNPKDTEVTSGTMDSGSSLFGTEIYGRKITGFMTNNDIYKTVCALFNVETKGDFTLGSDIFNRLHKVSWQDYDISVGIGFYNGLFFGVDLEDLNLFFTTRDFKTFVTNTGARPSQTTINAYKARMEDYADTLIKTRSYYDDNKKIGKFKDDHNSYLYYMGNGTEIANVV